MVYENSLQDIWLVSVRIMYGGKNASSNSESYSSYCDEECSDKRSILWFILACQMEELRVVTVTDAAIVPAPVSAGVTCRDIDCNIFQQHIAHSTQRTQR